MNDKRLIEETIPLEDISRESAREKSIRQGHISTLHIWWARRPLVACRAAVFGSLVIPSKISRETLKKTAEITKRWLPGYKKVNITDKELGGKEFYHFMRILCTWEASNNKEIIEHARLLIRESHDGNTPKVLDPFAGGGSIPLEALRLGCETYANELNPIAHIIELCTLVYPQKYGKEVEIEVDEKESNGQLALGTRDKPTKRVNKLAEDVRKWSKWIVNEAKKEIGSYYLDINGSIPIAYIWAKSIKCPNPLCNKDTLLMNGFWLVNHANAKIALKPKLDSTKTKIEFIVQNDREIDFNPNEGTIKNGGGICLFCRQTIPLSYILDSSQSKNTTDIPIASILEQNGKKIFRIVNQVDKNNYDNAGKHLKKLIKEYGKDIIPTEPLPERGSLGISPHWSNDSRSNKSWSELFNDRQLLSLTVFSQLIKKAYAKMTVEIKDEDYITAVLTYIALGVDRMADRCSRICRWDPSPTMSGINNTFSRQALQMVWDYAESNPFSNSSGSWLQSISWIPYVIEHCSKIENTNIKAMVGSATNVEIGNNSVDCVITDPPYYDAVPYADLSDFFYVWLKRSIGFLYPKIFKIPLTPKSQEIIQSSIRHNKNDVSAKDFFEKELSRAFVEISRVLVPDGIVDIMFAHKTTTAWETLINSLFNARLIVTSSWPIQTEMKSRTRAHGSAALASSILLNCRRITGFKEGYYDEVKSELKIKIEQRLNDFWTSGIRGSDFFISAIGPAIEVFGKYNRVKKLSGEEITVSDFLSLVRQEVTNYALQKILTRNVSTIDPETRFYILWRWAYDSLKVPFDDARILAQAIGTEVDNLMSKTGVLKKTGESVELLGPLDIKITKIESIIDALHKSCQLWAAGKKQDLAEFLEENGKIEDENFWSTAQGLSEVLPDGDKEKQLLQGLLASKSGIADLIKQTKLF